MVRRFPLLVLLAGCLPEFATVDEACKEEIRGEKHSDVAADAFNRMVCYRRVAGLRGGSINKHVQEAVTAHASYLSNNGVQDDWIFEDPSLPGFTGASDWERLEAAGFDEATSSDTGIWLWAITDSFDPYPAETMTERIDLWMGEPYYRQVVLQPSFDAAGLAHVSEVWYGTVVYDLPPEQHAFNPILYPSDGQTDVPTTWVPAGLAGDAEITPGVAMGFPVSITVATTDPDAVFGDLINPLSLSVQGADLEGPDGPVPFVMMLPNTALGPYPYSASLIPTAPLAPDATYTFTATVSWADKEKEVMSVFTTAAE